MNRAALAVILVAMLASAALAGPEDHIVVPPPDTVHTYSHEGYNVHIYVNPNSTATDDNRTVLLLGTASGPGEVLADTDLVNPKTRQPYDVIIGLGSDSKLGEFARVICADHFDADVNTKALREAIQDQFGGSLHAALLDTHSNGNTLGVTAMLASGDDAPFTGVHEMHAMGPDIGYGGHYFNADNLAKIHGAGVEIYVYVNRGDFVPTLGYASQQLVQAVRDNLVDPESAFRNAAKRAVEAFTGQQQIAQEGQKFPDVVHYQEFDSIGPNFVRKDGELHVANHEVRSYLSLRQGLTPDLASAPEMDPDLLLDEQWMENAIKDGRDDVLAKGLENLASKLSLAQLHSDRQHAIANLIQTLQLEQTKAVEARSRRQMEIDAARARATQWQGMELALAQRQSRENDWSNAGSPPQPPPPPDVASGPDTDNEPSSSVNNGNGNGNTGNTNGGGNNFGWGGSSTYTQLQTGNIGW